MFHLSPIENVEILRFGPVFSTNSGNIRFALKCKVVTLNFFRKIKTEISLYLVNEDRWNRCLYKLFSLFLMID